VQLSISHEDLCQSLEEQEATVHDLRRESDEARKALDSEVSCVPPLFVRRFGLLRIRFQHLFLRCWFLGLRTALGNTTTQGEAVQTAYNSSQQELEELRAATLEVC
jgi:hypothetical protein